MRRSDKRGLQGNKTAGQKGGAGMMGHLAVHWQGLGNPEGSGSVPIMSGMLEYMQLDSRGVGRLRYNLCTHPFTALSCCYTTLVVQADFYLVQVPSYTGVSAVH